MVSNTSKYVLKCWVNGHEDCYKLLAVAPSDTLLELNDLLTLSFGLDRVHLSSFFTLDIEGNRDYEITRIDMDEGGQAATQQMKDIQVGDALGAISATLEFEFDFLGQKSLKVELSDTKWKGAGGVIDVVGLINPSWIEPSEMNPEALLEGLNFEEELRATSLKGIIVDEDYEGEEGWDEGGEGGILGWEEKEGDE